MVLDSELMKEGRRGVWGGGLFEEALVGSGEVGSGEGGVESEGRFSLVKSAMESSYFKVAGGVGRGFGGKITIQVGNQIACLLFEPRVRD